MRIRGMPRPWVVPNAVRVQIKQEGQQAGKQWKGG
jgi:hypothetical protein